jgi:hypothetical protein
VPAPREEFQYALWRVVPHVERGECINAGVVLYCRRNQFLEARIALDRERLRALAPDADADAIDRHLASLAAIAAGEDGAGPIAAMDQPDRFHWLVAPSSTIVQPSPVHTGLCEDPVATLEHLFVGLVAPL